MQKKFSFKGLIEIFKNAFSGFSDNKVMKLSGSLAYYTVFSMAPLLIVIISLCGMFLGREAVEGKIYGQLAGFVGSDTAVQLQDMIKNASLAGKSKLAAIVGTVTLVLGATSIFAEIQDSINSIWGLKPKPKRGWLKMIQNRLLSFSVIISLGFLLLVSLSISSIIDGFSERLTNQFPGVAVIVFYIINVLITFSVTTLIFGVIFRVLPDADIQWKDVLAGAMATAFLFMLGKFGISFYISKSHVGSTYGAAGSLVVLLLWIYYSSLILYFGAELTKAYAVKYGSPIHPNQYAVTTKMVEVETGKQSIQSKESMTMETNHGEVTNNKK
ncbi:YihY/virulence factor BrkB family protein [Ferruginibacter paludis]|uniref:YihY/virulence factor BrkB family protein n=1 Tax=Ferruginibacter paludis TaxID=1310417 RepID=UPI0025B2A3CB|nr:YihY/virulence factor BrkB family protein [Ferruginibacter paludis]MDN3659441.1 YihY/virulence factor BrkB family protein [Ferruginibacter paludis]